MSVPAQDSSEPEGAEFDRRALQIDAFQADVIRRVPTLSDTTQWKYCCLLKSGMTLHAISCMLTGVGYLRYQKPSCRLLERHQAANALRRRRDTRPGPEQLGMCVDGAGDLIILAIHWGSTLQ